MTTPRGVHSIVSTMCGLTPRLSLRSGALVGQLGYGWLTVLGKAGRKCVANPGLTPISGAVCRNLAVCPRVCLTDRKSTRLNSSHLGISYAVFCLKKKTGNKICSYGRQPQRHGGRTPLPSPLG